MKPVEHQIRITPHGMPIKTFFSDHKRSAVSHRIEVIQFLVSIITYTHIITRVLNCFLQNSNKKEKISHLKK